MEEYEGNQELVLNLATWRREILLSKAFIGFFLFFFLLFFTGRCFLSRQKKRTTMNDSTKDLLITVVEKKMS